MLTQNQIIAQEILNVIGSQGKLATMIGAKDFVAIDNGLQFGLKRKANKINKIVIKVNGLDLYDVEFGNFTMSKLEYKTVSKVENIYADQLKSLIEQKLGLYLSL